jgi:formamidopyrimidine-DNA glycosylase
MSQNSIKYLTFNCTKNSMPELPEVETTCKGISPYVVNNIIVDVTVKEPQLRWPVPADLSQLLSGLEVVSVTRRGKYCLLNTCTGTIILHLGMSGNLRIVAASEPAKKHDHVDFVFQNNLALRFNDQRKFGAVLWAEGNAANHPLLKDLGPEPLTSDFHSEYLYQRAKGKKMPVKTFIMDGHIVVGVGNIYASESLFMAGILPTRPAGDISASEYHKLVTAIKNVLQRAIAQGGTTLKDFVNAQGKPGYFSQSLTVYGRAGQPCYQCQNLIQQIKIGQRASYFCAVCQC